MSNEELNDLLAKVAASAKQVNILTGDHASAPYYEAGAESSTTQNIYGDKNEFQDGAQLLKMSIPEGADPAEIAARIAEQQRALLEQKEQKK